MDRGTVVILIDALGHSIARRHGFRPADLPVAARLRTVLGFSQAAIASILTGVMPDRHGLWMMYSFARNGSPFGWLRLVPRGVSAQRLWLRALRLPPQPRLHPPRLNPPRLHPLLPLLPGRHRSRPRSSMPSGTAPNP